MYNQDNKQPQKPQSFGNVQETYKYRLNNFKSGDQFTIVEDMPKNKPIRLETKRLVGEKNGKKYDFDAKTYLIRISNRGYEADIELKPHDIPMFAILCPKGLDNFKGATFVFDGYNWSFMGIETPQSNQTPINNISSAMRDPRQPDLSAPTQPEDQRDVYAKTLVSRIQVLNDMGTDAFMSDVLKLASKICPGKEVDIVGYTKSKGLISEKEGGVVKVN